MTATWINCPLKLHSHVDIGVFAIRVQVNELNKKMDPLYFPNIASAGLPFVNKLEISEGPSLSQYTKKSWKDACHLLNLLGILSYNKQHCTRLHIQELVLLYCLHRFNFWP